MANVSRNVPPWAAVITIMPAVGGPSRTTFHSSGEKAACVVISGSCAPGVPGHAEDLAVPGRAPHSASVKVPAHDRIEDPRARQNVPICTWPPGNVAKAAAEQVRRVGARY